MISGTKKSKLWLKSKLILFVCLFFFFQARRYAESTENAIWTNQVTQHKDSLVNKVDFRFLKPSYTFITWFALLRVQVTESKITVNA